MDMETFPVSVYEVKCLPGNPPDYHLYPDCGDVIPGHRIPATPKIMHLKMYQVCDTCRQRKLQADRAAGAPQE